MNTNDVGKNKEIDISFCLPVYNVAEFLNDCLSSIISQRSDSFTYEIVCVDDLSTDDSFEILQNLANKIPQLRVFKNEENKGVGYTRNRLITLAQGDYIWFVDPDDMLYPNSVEPMFNEIKRSNFDVILGNYTRCAENEKFNSFTNTNQSLAFSRLNVEKDKFLPVDQTGRTMSAIWAGMFKRVFLLNNNLFFQEKMIAQEDTLFYYEFSLKVDEIIKATQVCYIYRQRSSSIMNTRSPERSKRYYLSMKVLYDVYKKHLLEEDYKNKDVLMEKIHHMRENLAVTLASIPDTKYVKSELRQLKDLGIYPFPFRTSVLYRRESVLKKCLVFLQPIEPFFWILHILYRIIFARNK